LKFLIRKEFDITVIELNAMAKAAITGLRNPVSPNIKLKFVGLKLIILNTGYKAPAAIGISNKL